MIVPGSIPLTAMLPVCDIAGVVPVEEVLTRGRQKEREGERKRGREGGRERGRGREGGRERGRER